MMRVELNGDDAVLVREIVDESFRELKSEIADTDNSEYKQQLKNREHNLARVLDQFGGPLPDAPG